MTRNTEAANFTKTENKYLANLSEKKYNIVRIDFYIIFFSLSQWFWIYVYA